MAMQPIFSSILGIFWGGFLSGCINFFKEWQTVEEDQ